VPNIHVLVNWLNPAYQGYGKQPKDTPSE
jgi:hypothetical protein